jgi:hypothetical protein
MNGVTMNGFTMNGFTMTKLNNKSSSRIQYENKVTCKYKHIIAEQSIA